MIHGAKEKAQQKLENIFNQITMEVWHKKSYKDATKALLRWFYSLKCILEKENKISYSSSHLKKKNSNLNLKMWTGKNNKVESNVTENRYNTENHQS